VLTSMSVRTKLGRGRPQKSAPRQVVTLTLPDDVPTAVCHRQRHGPRHRRTGWTRDAPQAPARATSGGGRNVRQTRCHPCYAGCRIEEASSVQLVPVADGRALISLNHPHSIPQLELDVREMLEHRVLRRRNGPSWRRLRTSCGTRERRTPHVVERSIIVFEARRGKNGAVD